MKNLFNNISQEEKNRILEMHSGKKNVISEQKEIDSVKQKCQKQFNLSSNELSITDFLINEFALMYAPIEGYGQIRDEETVKQLLKISNKQSYDKINQYLYSFAMSFPDNYGMKVYKTGEDIIEVLLNVFLTGRDIFTMGLTGFTNGNLRDMINNHLRKIGVKVKIEN